jgi:hypothetical protein
MDGSQVRDIRTPVPDGSVAAFITNGSVILPLAGSPACFTQKFRRRFFHLGVERSSPPPRDAQSLADTETFCAYIPTGLPGCDASFELRRALEFNASGSPPPAPKYYNDIDRCRHFVHGRSGTDVAAHFVNRPSYQLSTGGAPLSSHSSLLKEMLLLNQQELSHLQRRSGGFDMAEYDGSRSSSRRVGDDSHSQMDTKQVSLSRYSAASPSPSQPHEAAMATTAGVRCSSNPSSPSPTSRSLLGPLRGRVASSLEVARRGSSLEATRRVRRVQQLSQRASLLRALTRMGHPNQVTVYLPQ